MDEIRHREANLTAMAAIGPRKKARFEAVGIFLFINSLSLYKFLFVIFGILLTSNDDFQ